MASPLQKKRLLRLQNVLEPICVRDEFTSKEIRDACHEVSPAFVTKVLNQLTDEGILSVESTGSSNKFFRWQKDRENFAPHVWIQQQVHGKQITASPVQDRPRERLLAQGVEKLRTAELLAILIRVGRKGESALDLGELIANRFVDDLSGLRECAFQELNSISRSISAAAYCQIMAGIELGRRVSEAIDGQAGDSPRIDSSAAAISYCRRKFSRLAVDRRQEEFHIVTLDTKLYPIAHHQITVGTLDASLVHPREVFRPAIRDAASAIILLHNHPSGDPTPSREDIQVTERLKKSAEIVGIRVLDHIIVGSDACVSIADWNNSSN